MTNEVEVYIKKIEILRKKISEVSTKEQVNELVKQVIVTSNGYIGIHFDLLISEMDRMMKDTQSELQYYKTGFSLTINMLMISISGLGLYDLSILLDEKFSVQSGLTT